MSLGSFLKDTLGVIAPVLGTAIGGPLGGMAVKAIGGALLGDESATEEQIEQAIKQATPEDLIKLKQLDQDFKRQMKELDIDLERLHSDDRDSARRRHIESGDWIPAILGVCTVGGFFGALVAFMLGYVPEGAQSEFAIMLGILGGVTTQVYNFYFGSSKGSQDKNKFMSKG